MRNKNAQVVITRKHKRLNRPGHLLAFLFTGGTSGAVTAAKAATNAGYNARTRKLATQAETADTDAQFRAEHVPGSREYRARHAAR